MRVVVINKENKRVLLDEDLGEDAVMVHISLIEEKAGIKIDKKLENIRIDPDKGLVEYETKQYIIQTWI